MRALHLSPHPDDEAIGAPAMLSALKDEGAEIDNLVLSLGSKEQERRRVEVLLSCERLGFNPIFPDKMPQINGVKSREDFLRGEREVSALLFQIIREYDLIISPSHWDNHPAHEIVGRSLRRVLPEDIIWWQWSIWSDLPFPSLLYEFTEEEMKKIEYALLAHSGEIERNDYSRLLRARAEAISILAPEKIFFFGGEGIRGPYAEAVSAIRRKEDSWILSYPDFLVPSDPLKFMDGLDITGWIESDSPRYKALFS